MFAELCFCVVTETGRLQQPRILTCETLAMFYVKCSILSQKTQEKRRTILKRAEQYVKEYRIAERDEIRLKRQAKKNENFYVPAQPKLAFVIRIRGYVCFKNSWDNYGSLHILYFA